MDERVIEARLRKLNIIAERRLDVPDREENVFLALARHDVIGQTLAERIKAMTRRSSDWQDARVRRLATPAAVRRCRFATTKSHRCTGGKSAT